MIENGYYLRFDERKWAQSIAKVHKHMRMMEKNKYLEPAFSNIVTPIVRYVSYKFNISTTTAASGSIFSINQH